MIDIIIIIVDGRLLLVLNVRWFIIFVVIVVSTIDYVANIVAIDKVGVNSNNRHGNYINKEEGCECHPVVAWGPSLHHCQWSMWMVNSSGQLPKRERESVR